MPNALALESSPYLLQHAHNPVNWVPWKPEWLEKAKAENKLLLISIGYSACHWCHVMERECFEDEEVAEIMNRHFICIKIDREERPDIDQVYMAAVQVMSGRGGWPLNCFALPDGKPIYGGTYFPKPHWIKALLQLADLWKQEPEKAEHYAQQLTDGIRSAEMPAHPENTLTSTLSEAVKNWKTQFDTREGGPNRAPKFPLPNNYSFLLQYAIAYPEETGIREQVELTLDKMCRGGIYDQIGGGFCRYSTDMLWKVPHFEKMLYDNAQLIRLYAEGFRMFKSKEYETAIRETIAWCDRELRDKNGLYYSALDADSEGEEGLFYLWEEKEIRELLGKDASLYKEYFCMNDRGAWEGKFIPLRSSGPDEFIIKHGIEVSRIRQWKDSLLLARNKRPRPGLDDKCLASWNALMISGLCHAATALEDPAISQEAQKTALSFQKCFTRESGGLYHSWKNGKPSINAFLEDIAFSAQACLDLYEITFDEKWLRDADTLIQQALDHYSDEEKCFFYFTSDEDPPLIVRQREIHDNVCPASNSVMATVLHRASLHFDKPEWQQRALQMLARTSPAFPSYPSGYSNWMNLQLKIHRGSPMVIIVGNSVDDLRNGLQKKVDSGVIFAGSRGASSLPLIRDRYREGKTLIYVCQNGACQLPVETPEEALAYLSPPL